MHVNTDSSLLLVQKTNNNKLRKNDKRHCLRLTHTMHALTSKVNLLQCAFGTSNQSSMALLVTGLGWNNWAIIGKSADSRTDAMAVCGYRRLTCQDGRIVTLQVERVSKSRVLLGHEFGVITIYEVPDASASLFQLISACYIVINTSFYIRGIRR